MCFYLVDKIYIMMRIVRQKYLQNMENGLMIFVNDNRVNGTMYVDTLVIWNGNVWNEWNDVPIIMN